MSEDKQLYFPFLHYPHSNIDGEYFREQNWAISEYIKLLRLARSNGLNLDGDNGFMDLWLGNIGTLVDKLALMQYCVISKYKGLDAQCCIDLWLGKGCVKEKLESIYNYVKNGSNKK